MALGAREFIHPDECAGVIVGDAGKIASDLERLGKTVVATTPAF